MASLISIGCANAAKSASRSAAAQNKIVLAPEDYEWVSVTGSNLRVRVPKHQPVQASSDGSIGNSTHAIYSLSVDQFRVLQDKTRQMVNTH
jgi:hypothetical protein